MAARQPSLVAGLARAGCPPVDRLRGRLVRDATIVTGLDSMTIPLLRRLAQTSRPASIVVIGPDASHPPLVKPAPRASTS